MGFSKRNKVSAEFSMSSLTDIIFLLLIFFMLTANFVRINPVDLPKSDSKTIAPTSIAVSIDKRGKFSLNGQEMPLSALNGAIKRELRKSENKTNATVVIAADAAVPFDEVVKVMNIASNLRLKAIIATQPNS
ncbi:MAG: biopolymer transporter ExbD [Bacteroidota bacterium]